MSHPYPSTSIASAIISYTLEAVSHQLRQKQITQFAKKATATQFTQLSEQFISFLSNNTIKNENDFEKIPTPISKDSLAGISIRIDEDRRLGVVGERQSTKRSNVRKGSIPKTRNQSITKVSINRDKLQNFIKLDQTIQTHPLQPTQMQTKLRRYYLTSIQSIPHQSNQTIEQQQFQNISKKKSIMKTDRSVVYDYNGKVMYSGGEERNKKMEGILTLLRARAGGKRVVKQVERRKVEMETVAEAVRDSAYKRNRKYSTISVQEKQLQIQRQREIEKEKQKDITLDLYPFSPSFSPLLPRSKRTVLDLKLSEYRSQHRKYRSIQTLNLTTRHATNSHVKTRDTNQSKLTIDLSQQEKGVPRGLVKQKVKTQEKMEMKTSSWKEEEGEERFKTEFLIVNRLPRSKLSRRFGEISDDVIYLNPELYHSMING